MTLAIVLANADQIIQATDRRLSWNGKITEESACKVGHVLCDDATFLYSFTGLARIGNHVTSRWLLDTFGANAVQPPNYRNAIDILAKEASKHFGTNPDILKLPADAKRLTIMITGYTADDYIFNALISNFQDFTNFIDHHEAQPEFTIHLETSSSTAIHNPTMIQVVGQFHAVTEDDEKQLREMLVNRSPSEAIRQKVVALIQEISDRPRSAGTVGKKINTARLERNNPFSPVAGYESDVVENEFHFVDQIDIRTGSPRLRVADFQLSASTAITFPRVSRNSPCPCGSGKRYRFCHQKKRTK